MMMRAAALLLCFALAGCLTTDEPAPAAQPAQSTAAAPPPAPEKPAPAQRRGAPAATRGANAPPVPAQQPQEGPVDPVLEVRQTCWSQGNANTSFKNIEARADWVNKCITDKLKTLQ
jgi:hypothetical protein